MSLNDNFMDKLIDTFKVELNEKAQAITDGLLALERSNLDEHDRAQIIEQIFRAAHNIKGAARGVGVNEIGEIAHQIESIFSAVREKTKIISADIISVCLLAVDGMHATMNAFCEKKPLDFNLPELLAQLQAGTPNKKALAILPNTDTVFVNKVQIESQEHETIRVSLNHLERISSLLEDLQTNKITIEDHTSELSTLAGSLNQTTITEHFKEITSSLNKLKKNMNISVNEFSTILNILQDEVRMLRLIPATGLLRNIARSMRDLALELDKKIEFEIKGDGIKMDKMILEGLKDPLIHLIRNAIDHGIEPTEVRRAAGKPEIGTISIELIDEGDQIFLNISDDGEGINYKTIAHIAQEKNLILQSELEKMTPNEVLELIFRPGFSTKKMITKISGRGVGLDVVRTNVMNIKGDVTVTTQPGKKTTFKLRVPLTLSSDRGLIVKSSGQLFVIPISTLEHVMMLHPNEIREVEASQVILYEGHPVPIRTLADLLKLDSQESAIQGLLPVVVLRKDKNTLALFVEDVIGEREIVIKPLAAPLMEIPCVAGGTLAGNGQVMIVLNPNDLIKIAMHSGTKNRIASPVAILNAESRHHILLVDDSITTRTLEKNVLENNNYKVTVAVDGKEAWNLLQKETFSLLITDIEMPNMNGIELTERVKQHEKLQDLPVIIVTSLGSDIQKKRGIEVGADAYIVKNNFESKELLEIVAQLI
jgi:two-component system chemotaxis sensor kinase CheA